jgi:Tol biopolymer transport system component
MTSTPKRVITAEDLYQLQIPNDPQISPAADSILYTRQRIDRKTEKKYTDLWLVPVADGKPRQFTYGDWSDTMPRWSPDGRSIAFLSNRKDEKQAQIYIIPVDGGEARCLTDLKGTIGSIVWSPDSSRLLVQFRQKDAESIEREQDEEKKKLGVVAHHITRLTYKSDGVGLLPQERWHLWVIDVASGAATQLTKGEIHNEVMPAWSPSGDKIVYISNTMDDPDRNPNADGLFIIPVGGGEARQLSTFAGRKSGPSFSPDGRWIAFVGSEGLDQFWRSLDVWIVPADGSGPARNLTARFDVEIGNITLSDVEGLRVS